MPKSSAAPKQTPPDPGRREILTGSLRDRVSAIAEAAAEAVDDRERHGTDLPEPTLTELEEMRAELQQLQQRISEFEFTAEANVYDTEAKEAATTHQKAKTWDLWVSMSFRIVGVLVAICLLSGISLLYCYVLIIRPEIFQENIHDEWPKLAFVTGPLILVGLLATVFLKSLFMPTAKDDSLPVSDLVKACMEAMKGGGSGS